MKTRRRALPPGWYPLDGAELQSLVAAWESREGEAKRALAAVAPHAGWAFSGRLAALSWAALRPAATIAVVGGHLAEHGPVLLAPEEAFETPLGPLLADLELAQGLTRELEAAGLRLAPDLSVDNTVEVQLPFLKASFPESRVLWLRAPAGPAGIALGQALQAAASRLGREVSVLGSTDLTHYGPDYGFEPAGRGDSARHWVREVNDQAFLAALLALDPAETIRVGVERSAACSAGAAAAALAFALAAGADRGELLGYGTSLDTRPGASFVGYGAVGFYRAEPAPRPDD